MVAVVVKFNDAAAYIFEFAQQFLCTFRGICGLRLRVNNKLPDI